VRIQLSFIRFALGMMALLCLMSCGFHLRSAFNIPPELKILKITPNQPYEPFQRVLRKTLIQNGIMIVDCEPGENATTPYTLQLLSINFVERPVAYGSDVQVNRATLQLNVTYEIVDAKCCIVIPKRCIQVERDLSIVPNSVLGTEHERANVQAELYQDAATLLIRQLSSICVTR